MSDDAFKSIEEHRNRIDAIDRELVELFNARAEQALAIRALKPAAHLGLYDPKREEEIFEAVEAVNAGPLYNDDLRQIFSVILKVMKEQRA
jgi:chorismate mutase